MFGNVENTLWVEKFRPSTLDGYVGNELIISKVKLYLENGDVPHLLFYGGAGTGKTTLSTDPNRPLIGDDEHGWSDKGIFNFEGGCYAKVINLNKDDEPDIYNAIRHGALVENVCYNEENNEIDFADNSKTSFLHHVFF